MCTSKVSISFSRLLYLSSHQKGDKNLLFVYMDSAKISLKLHFSCMLKYYVFQILPCFQRNCGIATDNCNSSTYISNMYTIRSKRVKYDFGTSVDPQEIWVR